jgi:HSP20 family protein
MSLTAMQQPTRPVTVIRRWDPFRDMEDVYSRMSQLMEGFAGQLPATLADIEETDDAYIVEMDLPGVRTEDVSLDLRDNELRISGEIKEKERKGVLRRRSRRVGEFEHVVTLPGEVNPDKVEAKLSDGVLTVRLGKASTSKQRHIEIKSK